MSNELTMTAGETFLYLADKYREQLAKMHYISKLLFQKMYLVLDSFVAN